MRTTPMPESVARGRLIVPAVVVEDTLTYFRGCGDEDGPHEGLVFWMGRMSGEDRVVVAWFAPFVDCGPQHVFFDASELGRASRLAHGLGMHLVAQVHSHPGRWTDHSDGDDQLVVSSEGFFSLIVPNYGHGGVLPSEGAGIHQHQNGRWYRHSASAPSPVIVAPTRIGDG